MGEISWYKRDPERALSGMLGLRLDQRGAYNTVLDLIYLKANRLPDDDRFIAGWMGVDVRVWRRLKAELIGLGKLRIEDGFVRNERADVEVDRALHRIASARDAGIQSARIRTGKSDNEKQENNDLAGTGVGTNGQRPSQPLENKRKKKESTGVDSKRARRALPGSDIELPESIPSDAWAGFVEMRRKKRAPLTERAVEGILRKLETFAAAGQPPGDVLDQSTINCWTGVFELKGPRNGNGTHPHGGQPGLGLSGSGGARAAARFLGDREARGGG